MRINRTVVITAVMLIALIFLMTVIIAIAATPSTILGNTYRDANQNNRLDNGDTPLAGWTVNLTNSSGLVGSVVTNATGFFQFNNLTAGNYNISEVVQPGYTNTTKTLFSVSLNSGKILNITSLVGAFGNINLSTIIGVKYLDVNQNKKYDNGDTPLSGWTVNLTNSSGLVSSIVTNASGFFEFDNLFAGQYNITEVVQPGYYNVTPMSYSLTLSLGKTVNLTSLVGGFGNQQTSCIEGLKYNDTNGNGQLDPGEVGLSGWSINLSRDNVLINSTVTNATGFFMFCNLTAGNYTVSEVLLPGYVNTSPASVNVTLLPGQTLNVTVNFGVFGNALPGSIQGIKYLDTEPGRHL